MKKLAIIALLMAVPLAMGQAKPQQTCPVEIEKWNGQHGPYSHHVYIHYLNASDKPVSAIIFKAYTVDALGEAHDFITTPEFDVTEKRPLKPGKKGNTSFRYLLQKGSYGIWVYGVRFADGSVWKDDGSRSCSAVATF